MARNTETARNTDEGDAHCCYFCGEPTEAPLVPIYVPAIEQSVRGRVCLTDQPRWALRNLASKAGA